MTGNPCLLALGWISGLRLILGTILWFVGVYHSAMGTQDAAAVLLPLSGNVFGAGALALLFVLAAAAVIRGRD